MANDLTMDFCFEKWDKAELKLLEEYLKSISHPENAEWENRIVRTSYPLLSTYTKELREVAKSISKGNYLSFLALDPRTCHEELLLQGFVISLSKNADEQMRLLPGYLKRCDFASGLTRSANTFERRCGILIFFKFLTTDRLSEIFDILSHFKDEKEYYVNMAIAWLVCDAFIKRREETLAFLKSDTLSPWTQNKAISKCRDSFRVSPEDKALLLSLKK